MRQGASNLIRAMWYNAQKKRVGESLHSPIVETMSRDQHLAGVREELLESLKQGAKGATAIVLVDVASDETIDVLELEDVE